MPDPLYAVVRYPDVGAWRLHRAPTQLRPRDGGPALDRYDDPEKEYRVRYLATNKRGSLLEVLDHFRADEAAEGSVRDIENVEGIDLLEEEAPGAPTDSWLSDQRWARLELPEAARFVDVNNADNLAMLNESPRVSSVLRSALVRAALGPSARLDEGTIRMVGAAGRAITQAVSRVIYEQPAAYTGVAYRTRFDDDEQCWAVFDDRVPVTNFDAEEPLDNTNSGHLAQLADVARMYHLTLPPNWRVV